MSAKVARVPPIVYVIDASVAIKWFSGIDEESREKAVELQRLHLKRDCMLVAPSLLVYEVLNALRHNPRFEKIDTNLAFQSLGKMELALVGPEVKEIETAIEISYDSGITVYDASYLALAQERQVFLITADMKFYRKVRHFPYVIALQDLQI